VPKDLDQARYWFGLAAAQGNGDAKTQLARLGK
jgi:TPR repeat protein